MQEQAAAGWHVSNWGFWGWLETAIKLVGIGAGYIAFFNSSGVTDLTIGGSPRLAAVILVAVFTLAMIGVVFMRIMQKELISIGYSILNALGHIALLFALLRVPTQTTLPIIFAVAFILGELAKQRFLTISGYVEGGANTASMLMFSRVVAVTYLVLAIFLII
ncbi:MAG: hypothetical protein GC179_22225 [Anaerolineaceae bacterium]|nr:hypothetical protein [Anaerolineaceae bacterium]